MDGTGSIMTFVPLILLTIPAAVGAWWLAPKCGARRWLWVMLFLIPFVNVVAFYLFAFRVAGAILDKLNALTPKSS